jgi:hypothetical protein
VASIGLLALLCACTTAQPSEQEPARRLSALPSLTAERQVIPPDDIAYRVDGHSRHATRPRVQIPTLMTTDQQHLRFRIVSGYPIRSLQVGAFAKSDAHGVPVDGGDQFDCLGGSSACTTEVRAGSIHARVALPPSVRLVVVRETSTLPGGATVDVVWRFRIGPG